MEMTHGIFTENQMRVLKIVRTGQTEAHKTSLSPTNAVNENEVAARFIAASRRSGIPDFHARAIFEMEWKSKAGECVASVYQSLDDGAMTILAGPSGVGKTQAAVAVGARLIFSEVLRFVDDRRKQPLFTTARKMFREIRDGFESGISESGAVKKFTDPWLLIIDEIAEIKFSDFESRTMTEVIDTRYQSQKPLILIANAEKRQLGNLLGPSAIARIWETGQMFDCAKWPVYRGERGKK